MAESEKIEHDSVDLQTDTKQHIEDAAIATDKEHQLTLREALKAYPKAISWSVLLSTAVVMEGYDTILIGSFLASPSFVNTFHNTGSAADDTLTITAPWQSAVANGAYIGEILGLAATGILCDRFGNKAVMTGATVLMIAFIFISFFGETLALQLAGQILCGIPWGAYQTITTVYASEVLPVALRVVKHGKIEQAKTAVSRLQAAHPRAQIPNPDETVALLLKTDAIEQELTSSSSYLECFRGANLRRTEIATLTWTTQQMCGPVLQTFATYLFVQAGLASTQAFNMTLGLYAIAFVGTILSWPLIANFGRRTIFLSGLGGIFVSLMVVGFLGIPGPENSSASWAAGAFLLIFTFIYDSTVGPLTYVIVPEVSSSRLRHKTTVIAGNMYNVTCIWTGVLTPYMLNNTAWNWGSYVGFFWAGMTALCFVWAYFRLPETKCLTYAELDELFQAKVPARQFGKSRM
ncbi:hypothetical protein LTR95_001938 [Oleoguttula sp. CCFEE 5521]